MCYSYVLFFRHSECFFFFFFHLICFVWKSLFSYSLIISFIWQFGFFYSFFGSLILRKTVTVVKEMYNNNLLNKSLTLHLKMFAIVKHAISFHQQMLLYAHEVFSIFIKGLDISKWTRLYGQTIIMKSLPGNRSTIFHGLISADPSRHRSTPVGVHVIPRLLLVNNHVT